MYKSLLEPWGKWPLPFLGFAKILENWQLLRNWVAAFSNALLIKENAVRLGNSLTHHLKHCIKKLL